MSVSAWVGKKHFAIGAASLFKALFSTIYLRIEDGRWGSRFPIVMCELYAGHVSFQRAAGAKNELKEIQERFGNFSPSEVVWDFEKPTSRPPWGENIAPTIKNLAEYFVTEDGRDLLEVLVEALDLSSARGEDLEIA